MPKKIYSMHDDLENCVMYVNQTIEREKNKILHTITITFVDQGKNTSAVFRLFPSYSFAKQKTKTAVK